MNKKIKKKQLFDYIFPLTGYIPYVVFFIVPVLIALSFTTIEKIISIFTERYYQHVLIFTIFQAFLSSVISILIGLPGAYIFSRCYFKNKKIKKILQSLLTLPFILPSILVVLGFVIGYGNNGLINKFLMIIFNFKKSPVKILYTFPAVLMAHSFCNFPLVINNISDSILSLDSEPEEAARLEGLGEVKVFLKITLPRIKYSLVSVFILIFIYCYTSFSIVLILGGKPSLTTIGLEIYSLSTRMNYSDASALSIISILSVLFILFFIQKPFNKNNYEEELKNGNLLKLNWLLKIYLFFITFFALFPIFSIIIKSFLVQTSRGADEAFSLDAYKDVFLNSKPLLNTLLLSISSSVLASLFALSISKHLVKCRNHLLFNSIITVSMVISSVVLGLGYMIISRFFINVSSFILLVLAHSVISIPLCLRLIYPTYRAIPETYIENAIIEGANSMNVFFYINIPILKNSILSSLIFSFALSNGELGTSLLIGGRAFPLISVQIYRLINSYNYQGACAYGTVMLIFTFFIFLIKD